MCVCVCVCVGFNLNTVVRVSLTEKMKFEGGEEQACKYLGKEHSGRGKRQCKGPEAGVPGGLEEQVREVTVRGR